jgi:hypothetical protein
MRTMWWVLAAYLAVVGGATLAANSMTNSPTLDTVAGLPSTGSLLGSTGVTAGALDLGTAAAIWFLALR